MNTTYFEHHEPQQNNTFDPITSVFYEFKVDI